MSPKPNANGNINFPLPVEGHLIGSISPCNGVGLLKSIIVASLISNLYYTVLKNPPQDLK